jgi:hypothetical protein
MDMIRETVKTVGFAVIYSNILSLTARKTSLRIFLVTYLDYLFFQNLARASPNSSHFLYFQTVIPSTTFTYV